MYYIHIIISFSGRKFEVKILTPNSLEDEDSTSSMLSQEEVEAFQNMIVNLLVSKDYKYGILSFTSSDHKAKVWQG